MNSILLEKISRHWSKQTTEAPSLPVRWWQSPRILAHLNKLVCGKPLPGFSQGLIEKLKNSADVPLTRGVSIGCGTGGKEMTLLSQGIVKKFDLYELSDVRIDQGREAAKKLGLEDRVQFINADPFGPEPSANYDMVHWNNSLHHMFDVDQAVQWSNNALVKGGAFYMDDFVGPTRFQWSQESLDIASSVRNMLVNTKYIRDYRTDGERLPATINRPNPDLLAASDPSEAADSSNILPAVIKHFPDAEVILTGGVIYNLVLKDILANFRDNETDNAVLDLLLLIDQSCIDRCESHYAVALAFK